MRLAKEGYTERVERQGDRADLSTQAEVEALLEVVAEVLEGSVLYAESDRQLVRDQCVAELQALFASFALLKEQAQAADADKAAAKEAQARAVDLRTAKAASDSIN